MHYSGMQKMVYLFICLHMFQRFPEYQQGCPQVAFTPLLRFFFRFSALARAEGTREPHDPRSRLSKASGEQQLAQLDKRQGMATL